MIDNRLNTFLVTAEVKNLTRASEILNITQPAVSQHIKYLEEFYKVKLLCKNGKSMALTPEGEYLYSKAKELNKISKLITNHLSNKNSFIKKYNLGASLTIGGYTLPTILGDHRKLNNNVDVILTVDNTHNILKKLNSGDIELAIIEGFFNKKEYLYRKFKDDELILVFSPEHNFAQKEYVSIEDLLNGNLILREIGSGTRDLISYEINKIGCSFDKNNIYMEIGDIHAIISLVLSNVGYTIISKEVAKDYLSNGLLLTREIIGLNLKREFNFVYTNNSDLNFINNFYGFCMKH